MERCCGFVKYDMLSPDLAQRWVLHNARFDVRVLGWDADPPPIDDTMLLAALLGLDRVGLKILDERFFGGVQGDRIGRMLDDMRACRQSQWAADAQEAEMARLLLDSPTKLTKAALKLWLDAEAVIQGEPAARKRQLVATYPLPAQPDVDDLPWPRLREYSGRDAALTMLLYRRLEQHPDFGYALRLYRQIEEPLFPVLNGMEDRGIRIDTQALAATDAVFETRIAELRAKLAHESGIDHLDVLVPDQLREFLYIHLNLPIYERTKETQAPSTAKKTLERLALEEPLVRLVLEMKHLDKLRSTYTTTLAAKLGSDGRLHGEFNQLKADRMDEEEGEQATETGRLSSRNPNLQNIPSRPFSEAHNYGKLIRQAFVPREGGRWVAADYSGIELVILASLAGDVPFIEEFRREKPDPHTDTARRALKSRWDRMSGIEQKRYRGVYKNVNYLMPYGGGAPRLVATSGYSIPLNEAEELLESWFDVHTAVRNFQERQVQFARQHGYVETILGRRRYIPEIRSEDTGLRMAAERIAGNMPVQGTSADLLKLALRRVWELTEHEDIVNAVHDEIDLDTLREEADVRSILRKGMIEYPTPLLHLETPIRAEVSFGASWGDCK